MVRKSSYFPCLQNQPSLAFHVIYYYYLLKMRALCVQPNGSCSVVALPGYALSDAARDVLHASLGIKNIHVIRAGGFDFFSNPLVAPNECVRNSRCEHLTQFDFYGPAVILKCADQDRLYVDICGPTDSAEEVLKTLFDPFAYGYVTPPNEEVLSPPQAPWAPMKKHVDRIKHIDIEASRAKKYLCFALPSLNPSLNDRVQRWVERGE